MNPQALSSHRVEVGHKHYVREAKTQSGNCRCTTLLDFINLQQGSPSSVTSHTAVDLTPDTLLMTCRVLVVSPDGFTMEARALLDSASSALFVSERLAQALCLPRCRQSTRISGIAGISRMLPLQSTATLKLAPRSSPSKMMEITAIVVPTVTCDLPLHPVMFN